MNTGPEVAESVRVVKNIVGVGCARLARINEPLAHVRSDSQRQSARSNYRDRF